MYALARYSLESDEDGDWLDVANVFKKAAAQSNNDELPEKFYIDGLSRALAGFDSVGR